MKSLLVTHFHLVKHKIGPFSTSTVKLGHSDLLDQINISYDSNILLPVKKHVLMLQRDTTILDTFIYHEKYSYYYVTLCHKITW